MTDTTRPLGPDDDLGAVIAEYLPAASEAHGRPGHDTALVSARASQLMRLRAQGYTYQEIADEVGYSDKSTARQALVKALAEHEVENVTELRKVENMALDQDQRVLVKLIQDDEVPASDRIRAIDARTRLSARRSRLNGLDAPVQVQLSAGIEADLADALAEAEQVFGEVVSVEDERLEG